MMIDRIKRLTISALVSDNSLMGTLVLKGGNALDLAYNITIRGSMDIDFSLETDFTELEKNRIRDDLEHLLNSEFIKEELVVFDVKLSEKPKVIEDAVKDFWGGYLVEFKIISLEDYKTYEDNFEDIRRNAIALHANNSPKFTIDISKYEYVAKKVAKDLEGAIVYVYTPEMLAIEKLRALCQQNPKYKDIVLKMTPKSRARDFFDIYNINESFTIDFKSEENVKLCQNIFEAKRVPMEYIKELDAQRDLHKESWERVLNTIDPAIVPEDFDFYFDYVLKLFSHL